MTDKARIDWDDDKISYIKENFFKKSNKEIATELGLKLTTLRVKAYELGLKRFEMEYWTDEMVLYLKKNYKKIGDVEIAEIFQELFPKNKKWTKQHIDKKRGYLKLFRTDAQLQKIRARNNKNGRYSVNHWKRWIGKVTPVGEIRQWMSNGKMKKFIKLENGFVPYAPWYYLNHIGQIPKGSVVRVRDGNNLNIVESNLMLITREQNAVLNAEIRNSYPEELKEVNKLLSKLKKTIKNHEQRKST